MQLTKEQTKVLHAIVTGIRGGKQQMVMGGVAGSGKTVLAKYLSQFFPNFAVCAYTGKACDVLRRRDIQQAQTIHSLIYVPMKDVNGNILLDKYGNPTFILNPELEHPGIIIDEGSMVPLEIYNDLKSFNIPLIFVGDHGQLEPVGTDFNLMKEPDLKLEEIHRNAGEIAHFCAFIRDGKRPASFAHQYSTKKVKFISKKDAEKHFLEVDQVICAYNKTRAKVNRACRKELGRKDDWPIADDRVMCLKNDKRTGLFNGMQGRVVSLDPKLKNKMSFESDNIYFNVFFDPSQFNQEKYDFEFGRDAPQAFDYCWGITCHKAQGSEWERGMVLEEKCDLWSHPRWSYTAASRFKKELIWAS